MNTSIFPDKSKQPEEQELKKALGGTYGYWDQVIQEVKKQYPRVHASWHYSGPAYGWSFRLKDNKRVIIYLLPRDQFFLAAFVFGQKACEDVGNSTVSDAIKQELSAAKAYAEGRGIRLEVRDKKIIRDIKTLITIKLAH